MKEQPKEREISCFVCDKYFTCQHIITDHQVHIKEACAYFKSVAQGGNTS